MNAPPRRLSRNSGARASVLGTSTRARGFALPISSENTYHRATTTRRHSRPRHANPRRLRGGTHARCHRRCRHFPDRRHHAPTRQNPSRSVAIHFEGQRLTYGELDRRTNQVANGLIAEGVGRQRRIAILSKNGPAFFELWFGAAKVDVVLVPVNFRLAPPEVAFVVEDAGAEAPVRRRRFLSARRQGRAGIEIGAPDHRARRRARRLENLHRLGRDGSQSAIRRVEWRQDTALSSSTPVARPATRRARS